MPNITSQTFSFSPPQQDVTAMTLTGTVSGVPLDGAKSVTVPFVQPFSQVCNSVVVQYAPSAVTGYVVQSEVTAVTINGFTLTVYGGPIGSTDTFTYQAYGI